MLMCCAGRARKVSCPFCLRKNNMRYSKHITVLVPGGRMTPDTVETINMVARRHNLTF